MFVHNITWIKSLGKRKEVEGCLSTVDRALYDTTVNFINEMSTQEFKDFVRYRTAVSNLFCSTAFREYPTDKNIYLVLTINGYFPKETYAGTAILKATLNRDGGLTNDFRLLALIDEGGEFMYKDDKYLPGEIEYGRNNKITTSDGVDVYLEL